MGLFTWLYRKVRPRLPDTEHAHMINLDWGHLHYEGFVVYRSWDLKVPKVRDIVRGYGVTLCLRKKFDLWGGLTWAGYGEHLLLHGGFCYFAFIVSIPGPVARWLESKGWSPTRPIILRKGKKRDLVWTVMTYPTLTQPGGRRAPD